MTDRVDDAGSLFFVASFVGFFYGNCYPRGMAVMYRKGWGKVPGDQAWF